MPVLDLGGHWMNPDKVLMLKKKLELIDEKNNIKENAHLKLSDIYKNNVPVEIK